MESRRSAIRKQSAYYLSVEAKPMAKTTIEFTAAASARLDELANDFGSTKAAVVRNALSLYGFVADELAQNHRRKLAIALDNSVETFIAIPGLELRAARRAQVAEGAVAQGAASASGD